MSENIKPDWRGRIFRYAPLILWMCVVLSASSGQASMSNTSRFIGPFLAWLFPHASEDTLYLYHHYIRKLAHLTEYSLLAFWAFRAFYWSSGPILKKYWFWSALGLTVLVASIDEFHQSFLESRGGSIYDVLLDAVGGFVLLGLIYIILRIKNRNSSETVR